MFPIHRLNGIAVVLALLAFHPTSIKAQTACTQTLSPGANVASAVSSAAGGSVICLNSGSYGTVTFSGTSKSPAVTVRSNSGQSATMRLVFQNGANGIKIDSATITGSMITGSTTKNITVQNSKFTGHAVFDGLANSNVLFSHNTHNDINGGYDVNPARLHLSYSSSTHSGVTIENSLMSGGSSDGVQSGVGVNIIGNEFVGIHEGSCSECHTDAIQLLGARGSVVRGNYIHDVSTGIVAFDGISNATIENNIVDTGYRPWGIELYSDSNSVIRHNTLLYRANCAYNTPCGIIALDRKTQDPAGTGTIITDNIATQIGTSNGSTLAQRGSNLLRSGASGGDISGSPTYVGGSVPTSAQGYLLASSSAGKGRGQSPAGSDVGVDVSAMASTPAPKAPSNLSVQ